MKKIKQRITILLLAAILCFSSSLLFSQNNHNTLIRLTDLSSTDISWLKTRGYNPQFDELPDQALLSLPADEISLLSKMGFSFELLRENMRLSVDEAYHSYEEIWSFIDSIAAIYPDIMMVDTLGYSQLEALPLPLVKISDNPYDEEDEIVVLYDGMHHAREPIGAEICMKLIIHLLENYGSDPDVDFWVNETEIFILPMINPEGWKYITDENLVYPFWRKNKRDNDTNGIFTELYDGVDLNRNYAAAWEAGDPDISSWGYRGPTPLSESELQAKIQLVLEQKPVMGITYHSYGEVVIYSGSLGGIYFPDHQHIAQVGAGIASNITKVSGGTYNSGFFALEAGLSNFWMYTEAGCFEYCIETGTDFIPAYELADQVSDANLPGALFLLDRVRGPGITGHISDSANGDPLAATYKVLEYDNSIITPRSAEGIHGRYFRPLLPGTYSLEFSCPGYYPKTIENVAVSDGEYVELDVKLVQIGTGTDIIDIEPEVEFSFFPNPAKDKIYIQKNEFTGNLQVEVVNLSGIKVQERSYLIETAGQSLMLDISGFKPGLYFIVLTSDKGRGREIKRLIKF